MKLKERLKREKDWLNEEYGIITPAIMAVFRIFQYLPFQVFIGNRTDHYYRDLIGKEIADKKKIANRRATFIEIIMLIYLTTEILIPLLIDKSIINNAIIKYTFLIILILRLIDILQVNVNMILFDGLRFKQNLIAKYSRAIILLIWNYIELIIIFGYIYFVFKNNLCGYKSIIDTYYFSTITQLTIGYGDLHPIGWLKFISGIQGIIGTLFLVLIIAKVINLLPNLGNLDDKNTGANTRL